MAADNEYIIDISKPHVGFSLRREGSSDSISKEIFGRILTNWEEFRTCEGVGNIFGKYCT